MAKLKMKEAKYIEVELVNNDPMQVRSSPHSNPTYTLVNWMRVKNIQDNRSIVRDVSSDGVMKLDFGRKIDLADDIEMSLFAYIHKVLRTCGKEVKEPEAK